LLLAAGIIGLAYVVAYPLLGAVKVPFEQINLPLGIAAMFLGAFTIVVRAGSRASASRTTCRG
jgi:predicted membrane-bound mannosyltransferase